MKLQPLLARQKSEVIFNFMFDFINRAASMREARRGLDELMPYGDWKGKLAEAEPIASVTATPEERKQILVGSFGESLRKLGGYEYVAETTVLRPFKDRPLYCLCYATRHETGISVFRDCQIAALNAQATTRAAVKVQHAASSTGQTEMFEPLHDMGPNEIMALLAQEKMRATTTLLDLVPKSPDHILYRKLWATVLSRHVVRLTDVNAICAEMRKKEELLFPDWEIGKRVPKDRYRTQRPA
jgi:hypothetical protein